MAFPSTAVEGQRNTQNWLYLSGYLIVGKGAPEGKVKGRIGAIYVREDGESRATLYVKEANDGAAEGWALLAGGNRDYGLVTALPTTPTPAKGDTCKLLVDEATGKVWDLVYTAPGSSPWSKIGGPPLRAVDPNTREGTATTFQTTGSPSVTTPLAGDYRVNWGARRLGQGNIGAGDGGAVVCVFINAVEQAALTAEVRANDQHRGGPAPASEVVTIAASLAVQPRYKALNANGYRVDRMFVEIDPVRVG